MEGSSCEERAAPDGGRDDDGPRDGKQAEMSPKRRKERGAEKKTKALIVDNT